MTNNRVNDGALIEMVPLVEAEGDNEDKPIIFVRSRLRANSDDSSSASSYHSAVSFLFESAPSDRSADNGIEPDTSGLENLDNGIELGTSGLENLDNGIELGTSGLENLDSVSLCETQPKTQQPILLKNDLDSQSHASNSIIVLDCAASDSTSSILPYVEQISEVKEEKNFLIRRLQKNWRRLLRFSTSAHPEIKIANGYKLLDELKMLEINQHINRNGLTPLDKHLASNGHQSAYTKLRPKRIKALDQLIALSKRWLISLIVFSLALGIYDFYTDISFFCDTLSVAHDMEDFRVAYLIFLIFASIVSLWDLISSVVGMYLIYKKGREYTPLYRLYLSSLAILLEDLPLSSIILASMVQNRNCGYVVSLTYKKSSALTSSATFVGVSVKLCFLVYYYYQDTLRSSDKIIWLFPWMEKTVVLFIMLLLIAMVFPLAVILGCLVQIYKRMQPHVPAPSGSINSYSSSYIVGVAGLVMSIPLYISAANLYFITNLDELASHSGCTSFVVNASASVIFPIANSSVCGNNRASPISYYPMQMSLAGEFSGSNFLRLNKVFLSDDCDKLLPVGFVGTPWISAGDNCTAYLTVSYSTIDFNPEFNIAIMVTKNTTYSACVKPYSLASFPVTHWASINIVESVGKVYCGLTQNTRFNSCLPAKSSSISTTGFPCYDCVNRCYMWQIDRGIQRPAIKVASLVGSLVVNGREYIMRYNKDLATACDVDSDWKVHKFISL